MPPPSAPHPPAETLTALVERIENKIDSAAKLDPNPGSRPFQRLNRAEYKAAVKDLLGIDVDPGNWLRQVRMAPAMVAVIFIVGFGGGIAVTYNFMAGRSTPIALKSLVITIL